MEKVKRILTVLIMLVLFASSAEALTIQGEHRLMASYELDFVELRAAEALVFKGENSWVEFVVTKKWTSWYSHFELDLSYWITKNDWDYGAGFLWKVHESQIRPWVMLARPW